jgi:peptidoglycan/xylan/chitin deacetylase (PgdA/CDA1 family)
MRCVFAVPIALFALTFAASAPAKEIAITFDDLPAVSEGFPLKTVQADTRRLLETLRRHHVVATGFVNEDKLWAPGEADARIALLTAWLDAGMELGNHGFGHLSLQTTPLETYEEAVIKGEAVTRRLLAAKGRAPKFYRYPFNQTGPTAAVRDAFQDFLHGHGYAVAPFTVEDDDAIFAAVYADDLKRQDSGEAARLRAAYLSNLDQALTAYEAMSQGLFDRQIPQVLLIHANRLNADTLEETLARLEQRGYRFVTFDAALRDPAYASPDGYVGGFGPSWLRRWSDGLKRKVRPLGHPDPVDWVQKRYDALPRGAG